MSTEFNVNRYWLDRGRTYIDERRTPPEFHRLQERFLLDVLERSRLPLRRVLEIGCGFGRVTRLLAERWPDADILGVDLSPEQLANARRHCGESARVRFEPWDFYSGSPVPGGNWDVIVAIEVFLHHPPEVVVGLFRRLAEAGRHLVNIDWSEDWPGPLPEHVWVHDFARLYAEAGLACATFPLPEKLEGRQQKLFIGGRELSPAVRDLESALGQAPAGPVAEDEWTRRLRVATAELRRVVSDGATLILVDDAQWGRVRDLSVYRVLPFLERDSAYWGPPADDATAWRELERMRAGGATHLVFAWPSFWWLQQYAGFARRLRETFPCVIETPELVVFALSHA